MDALKTRIQELANDPEVLTLLLGACFFAMIFSVLQDMRNRWLDFKKQNPSTPAAKKDEGNEDQKEVESTATSSSVKTNPSATGPQAPKPKAFALPDTPLPAPNLSKTFTADELLEYDGSDDEKPIYVGIKGIVFDVSTKKTMYGPEGGYRCFAGRDSSKALGLSSLKVEDCIADYSSLDEKQIKTLEDWYKFFEKRYPIVGKIKA
ncbi:hypothetical protein BGZ83_003580 [Gryganskiella cystojenkinii]|nr:hypothetical protein BGZ83_003580 [Gryganskiella cystojenkinii]